jgi:nucleotide-binding universal stress UspA family protein
LSVLGVEASSKGNMIKDVLVNLDVDSSPDVTADYAVSVARAFEAHISAVAFTYEAVLPGSIFGRAALQVIEAERARYETAAQNAVAKFKEGVRQTALSAEAQVVKAGMTKAGETFGQLARRFDLAIVAQSQPNKSTARQLILEAALFDSGRPMLVVPYIQRTGLKLDSVMMCWDGSRSAARATGDAMPFLARAKAVEVVLVASEAGKSDEIAGADIAHHLARHGLKVELKQIVARDVDVANTILSHAADAETDLIVMGGYGHSRLREFVLGGATRGILSAMTVPTLMSH